MKPYYDQDGITIYHGDCREVLPYMPKVDLVLTDPPYGIKRFQKGFGSTRFRGHRCEKNGITWDVAPTKELLDEVLGAGIAAIVWGYNNLELPRSEHFLVWDKEQTVDNFASAEIAYSSIGVTAKVFRYSIHVHNQVWKGHPTQKPESLMRWCINLCPNQPQTILDPFMGSGTTLVAAKVEGCRAIGIEIEERYCEIAANRLAQGVLFGPEPTA